MNDIYNYSHDMRINLYITCFKENNHIIFYSTFFNPSSIEVVALKLLHATKNASGRRGLNNARCSVFITSYSKTKEKNLVFYIRFLG